MNTKELKILSQKIIKEIYETRRNIEEYSKICKPIAPENAIGRVSRMDAINNKSVVESALRTAKDRMRQLEKMKNKINDVDFGICQRCRNPIPLARLMIRPESNLCVICAK